MLKSIIHRSWETRGLGLVVKSPKALILSLTDRVRQGA